MYLNSKQKVHLHNAMDYKPRASFSVMYKFHNSLIKLGRTCTRRIDLTCAQHVNMKAHYSSAPLYNSTNRTNILYLLNYIHFILSSITCYSHVYKLLYISIATSSNNICSWKRNFLFAKSATHCISLACWISKEGERWMSTSEKANIDINIYFWTDRKK